MHEQSKEIAGHRLPAQGRRRVEERQFACLPIDRDPRLNLIDQVQSLDGKLGGVWHLAGIEDEFKSAGHRRPTNNQRVKIGVGIHRKRKQVLNWEGWSPGATAGRGRGQRPLDRGGKRPKPC